MERFLNYIILTKVEYVMALGASETATDRKEIAVDAKSICGIIPKHSGTELLVTTGFQITVEETPEEVKTKILEIYGG